MRKFTRCTFILGLALTVTACTSTTTEPPQKLQNSSGFLPDYSLLKPIASPKGSQFYAYKNPTLNPRDYHAALVEPVVLLNQTTSQNDVSRDQIETVRLTLNQGIQQIVQKRLSITHQAGPGVIRIQIAITAASVKEEGFKPWNIIPVSALLKLGSMATGNDKKKAMLVVEVKVLDSTTGALLKEVVAHISGDNFRKTDDTGKAFAQLATQWIQKALTAPLT